MGKSWLLPERRGVSPAVRRLCERAETGKQQGRRHGEGTDKRPANKHSPGEELAGVETAGAKVLRWEVGAAQGTVVGETEGLTPRSPKP